MCGIFGVLGRKGAPRLVHDGLRRLEYRGYDSCGVAWSDPDGLQVTKAVGPVAGLEVPDVDADTAIGHTRWATHGGVTKANAHPHLDSDGRAAVVHNGVLLNHARLRRELEAKGAAFRSDTDSECLVHLWRAEADDGADGWGRLDALRSQLTGTYSVAILDREENAIAIAKHRNPLWVARTDDGTVLLASDAVALAPFVDAAIPLEDGDHGILSATGGIVLRDQSGKAVERNVVTLEGLEGDAHLGGYEHYMLKEIHETPSALNRLIATHVRPRRVALLPDEVILERMVCLGAGTSYHAALLSREFIRRIARVPAQCHTSPEWKDDTDIPEPGTTIVAFSQSGETLDTVQALARIRSHPHQVIGFTNHPMSTIGRQSDLTVSLRSGKEVSVAATKTFLSQSLLGYLLALQLAVRNERVSSTWLSEALDELVRLPRRLARMVHDDGSIRANAAWLAGYENLFLLAKGLDLPAAMEGALKLKEIAYQHAEAYPAGELKHGPFALLTEETPVVFLVSEGDNMDSLLNSLEEVAARGSPTLVLAIGDVPVDDEKHRVIRLPNGPRDQHPFIHSTALHLLSYWTAKARGLPIDKPRNLAKSVTVE